MVAALVISVGVPIVAVAQQTGSASSSSQTAPAQASQAANADIYRVSAFRAAPGQIGELEKLLTSNAPSPGAGQGDFTVVFRHREGNEWDFLTIEHMGQQATIDLRSGPAPQPDTPLSHSVSWHGDTYAAGPSLEEFRRALNLPAGTSQASTATESRSSGVYVISDYMPAAGHRGQLRQVINDIAGDRPGASVTLTHVEGAPWSFLTITRYDSWQQFAQSEEQVPPTQSGRGSARGEQLREHLAVHHDTLATIQAVTGSASSR